MEIHETNMEKWNSPSIWQRLKNSIITALMGIFIYFMIPYKNFIIVNLDNSTIYIIWCFYLGIVALLGWFFGDKIINLFYVKIMDNWDPRDMFK